MAWPRYLPFWACLFQRWQVLLYGASTTASLIVSHSHLLDGIAASGSRLSAVSSRFYPLMTSRQAGIGLYDEVLSHRLVGMFN